MKFILPLSFLFSAALAFAQTPSAEDVIERARTNQGDEADLNGLVTLQMTGGILPSEPKMPKASLLIIARKPGSQRLEVRVDDLVETTILQGDRACIVRTNLNSDASQMRTLTGEELGKVQYSTRQFFNYFRPDVKNGEKVTYEGIVQRRGIRCHSLLYVYPDGTTTKRFFAVSDDRLISTVSDSGVESVEIGSQLIGGIRFPEKVDYFQEGKKLHTIVLTNVFVNKPLPENIFRIPQGGQKKKDPSGEK